MPAPAPTQICWSDDGFSSINANARRCCCGWAAMHLRVLFDGSALGPRCMLRESCFAAPKGMPRMVVDDLEHQHFNAAANDLIHLAGHCSFAARPSRASATESRLRRVLRYNN